MITSRPMLSRVPAASRQCRYDKAPEESWRMITRLLRLND